MDAPKQFTWKEYQQIIKSNKPTTHWTQFDLDLISCIRDEHPVIYAKTGDWSRYQRAAKIGGAWKQIGAKFSYLPLEYIKLRWKNLVEQHSKLRKNVVANNAIHEKFLDGTFSFLDSEVNLANKPEKNKQVSPNANFETGQSNEENTDTRNIGAESENSSSMDIAYKNNIRQLIHEEIDIGNDNDIEMKMEAETFDDDGTVSHDMAQGDVCEEEKYDFNKDDQESQNKWSEEELMNATRLTKEMIQELILIKTRECCSAPVSVEE